MAKSESRRTKDAVLCALGIRRSHHADKINAENAGARMKVKGFELLLYLGRDRTPSILPRVCKLNKLRCAFGQTGSLFFPQPNLRVFHVALIDLEGVRRTGPIANFDATLSLWKDYISTGNGGEV